MTEQSGALAGKVAFVAGASRGIGATVATALAREGAAVAVAARSEQQGKVPGTIHSVADGITAAGGRAMPVSCDVTSEESVENAVAATVSEFGGIDILIANAGVLWLGPIESTPLKRWQLCLNVNLTGVFLVTKAVIPHVKARGGGSLVAITTTGVGMIEHGANAYWVSKAAVERLYLGLAADLKPDNIAVNCLSPSRVVLTEGWQAGGGGVEIPPEMVEPPEAMADAAVLLAQQDAVRHHRHHPALRGTHRLARADAKLPEFASACRGAFASARGGKLLVLRDQPVDDLVEVGGPEGDVLREVGVVQRRHHRLLQLDVHQALGGLDGLLRQLQDLLRACDRLGQRVGDDVVGQPEFERSLGLDPHTRQGELLGLQQADLRAPDQRAAVGGHQTDRHVRVGEERGLGHVDDVRERRQAAAQPDGRTVDRGDHRDAASHHADDEVTAVLDRLLAQGFVVAQARRGS